MHKDKINESRLWRRFIQKNLLYYIVPNVVLNSCIPYFSFKDPNAVYLFQGEYCFARFLLPMALFLPFVITFDILKKTIAFSEKADTGLVLPAEFMKNKFMFRMAGINGGITLMIILVSMLAVQLNLPENYSFDGTVLAVFLGVLAGMLSLIFTLWPLQRLKKLVDDYAVEVTD